VRLRRERGEVEPVARGGRRPTWGLAPEVKQPPGRDYTNSRTKQPGRLTSPEICRFS
jgi:hypothetical protein